MSHQTTSRVNVSSWIQTMIAGFTPRQRHGSRPHVAAVVAFDGVVLSC